MDRDKRTILLASLVAFLVTLVTAPVSTQAQTSLGQKRSAAPDAPACVNTANGITGGGCSGDITLRLGPQGVIASTFGFGLRVDSSATISGSAGVYGKQGNGAGLSWNAAGVWGDSNNSIGMLGTSASGWGVYGKNTGSGSGVKGESSTGYGVEAISTGTGIYARGGNAIYGEGQGSNGTGVWGVANNGTGARGVYGNSSSGTGVVGRTTAVNGTGVEAIGNGTSSTALKITDGGIRVVGAGLNTPTAVFTHVADNSNIYHATMPYNPSVFTATMIDNPFTNNNPNAILFITHNGLTLAFEYVAPAVFYNSGQVTSWPQNRWYIYNSPPAFEDQAVSSLDSYNVMVITP